MGCVELETSSAVTLLTALGSYSGVLGHGGAPGERTGSVRPTTALRHLLGASNFKSLEQVPRYLLGQPCVDLKV